jgi:HD-GYP domain-containing protein (c-di-GMP phosphodiesterase class II)
MTTIAAGSIELGTIPFNLYAPDHKGRLVLFCKSGHPITEKHFEVLGCRDRGFYIGGDDYEAYLDYAHKRLDKIIKDPEIRISDKANITHGIAKRTVRKLLDNPSNAVSLQESNKVVDTFRDLILFSPEAASSLFNFSSLDPYAFSHSINTSIFCLLLGEKMIGQRKDLLSMLGIGGMLLDIGKMRIDQAIVFKPGKLTDKEVQQVRMHTIHSYDIAKEMGMPEPVLALCRSHHERLDGSGYPDGLRGDDIHPFARIAAVADVYDALTSDRIYRKQTSHLHALTTIAKEVQLYDLEVYGALLEIVLRNEQLIITFCDQHVPIECRKELIEAAARASAVKNGDNPPEGGKITGELMAIETESATT